MNKAQASLLQESSDSTHRAPCQTASFWFATHFLPVPLAIGFLGPLQGLSLWQSLLAIIPAVLLGSLVPVLCRSLRSAILLLPIALLLHVLNLETLSRVAIHLLPGTPINWQAMALMLATLIAFIGPALLYRMQTVLAPLLALVFGLLTMGAVLLLETDTAQRQLQFSWSAFALQAVAAALWQISLTPLASKGTPHYLGIALPGLWLMSLGALMASAIPAVDTVVSLRLVGERFYPGLGSLAVLLGALAMVGSMAAHAHAVLPGRRLNEKARGLALAGFALLALWIERQLHS